MINISSGATLATYPTPAAYASASASARAGLNMLSAVARLELASAGITLSTFYPFMTATEFYQAVKAGQDQAIKQQQESAAFMHSPQQVAGMILRLITSGEAQSDRVAEAYGGSYRE
ncbi:SDR family NAD(P)-dependent oxidoreductase [Pantoea piersonii]|uniref:SDR family NAD(P)-dependent oxidoreductase n=1 Tax=Pantoea piersonii TaxID=2364647 RepID=UPI001DCF8A21|nr:SDR family NAD(P)-dependent oxidoreductase [Pantoea piersonii]MBZ6408933.1 SDR family NAD(P)-dependent oxidoreductase [Pantoea piersonii]MBZ6427194.1 SDR family NAD(P)-dependent oxidoreductase [Pantoea piersonii]